ncbi:hypothetical protein SteCoe_6688 [Stentor coeruleus]|uniref:Uncharacterized protein n=1 Tax=Stentor coeruleus TaxID=5963 RepID=A0A1R2CP95_9CILI|nr:hypothetical protein SteCoe_6688 [Stentor coeruleus]
MAAVTKKSNKSLIKSTEKSPNVSLVKSSSSRINAPAIHDLILPSVDNLDSLILSRKRILEGLKFQYEDVSNELMAELLEKDSNLNGINKRILSLKFKIFSKTKSTKENLAKKLINGAKTKLQAENKDNQRLKERVKALSEEYDKKNKEVAGEMDKLRQKILDLNDMGEIYSEELKEKNREYTETLGDFKEVKKIYSGMSEIHNSIEAKMEEKRLEIGNLMDQYYECMTQCDSLEDLEAYYSEIYIKSNTSKEDRGQMKKKFKKAKNVFLKIQNYPAEINNLIENLQEVTGFIENIIDENDITRALNESKNIIERLNDILDLNPPKPLKILEDEEKKSRKAKGYIKDAEKKMVDLNKAIQKLEGVNVSKILNDLRQQMVSNEQKNNEKMQNLQQEIKSFKQKAKPAKQNFGVFLKNNQKLENEFNVIKTKLEASNAKLAMFQNAKKNEVSKQEELKNEINSLKKRMEKQRGSVSEIENAVPEKKLHSIINQVTALHEEIMKKDTQIIKKIREQIKIKKETKQMQQSIEGMERKINQTKEELYSKVDEEIKKKDKEIEMLKEIVKGNAQKIKAEEASLNSIRRQLEQSPNMKSHRDLKLNKSKQ